MLLCSLFNPEVEFTSGNETKSGPQVIDYAKGPPLIILELTRFNQYLSVQLSYFKIVNVTLLDLATKNFRSRHEKTSTGSVHAVEYIQNSYL
ncbi:hypothetical protein ACFXTH_001800 [Malus domestica]